jgi:dihydrofolate synthase/folylpolyglutamate synthase
MNSHLYQSGVSFEAVSGEDPSIVFRGEFHQQYREFKYKMNLNGQHQVRNSALAVAATSLLGIDIASQQIGLTTAFWPGRCELLDIKDRRAVLLDAAHNPDGMQSLCNYLKSSLRTSCDVIFSALEGKDWRVMVDILAPHIVNWHLVTAPHSAGVPAQVLGDYLREKSPSCSVMVHTGCPKECYRSLVANTVDRLLLVTGSMYLLGAVRPLIVKSDKVLWRRGSTPASADLLN